jgi:hypothetical protein
MQFFLTLFKKLSLELFFWTAGLLCLALINPAADHFSLCVLKSLGFEHCPGCGLGAAISYLFHGEIAQSLASHPLGLFALITIAHRIITLTRPFARSPRRVFDLWRTQG